MRIGIVTETWPPEINGVALTVAGLVHGLVGAGHAVQLVRPRQDADDAELRLEAGIATTLTRGVRLPHYPGLQFGLPAARRLRALWKRERPDAIYVATEGPLGWSALRVARALGIPASTGFHTRFDDFARHYGLGALTPAVFAWLRHVHGLGAATLVPTAELSDFLGSHGFANVVRLPRAVDQTLFDPARRDHALRAQWGVGPRQLAVIHVGRIAPEKNLALAVRCFREIQEIFPDVRYVWVGDGPERARLAIENPDFVFTGIRRGEDLARHFASADLFLFPSLTETFGNVTLEALASGVPTVAFDYGAAHEHLRDACGRAVPFNDEDAFVRAAREVVLDRAGTTARRKAARAAVADLDPHTVTSRFAQLLAQLASDESAGSAPASRAEGQGLRAEKPGGRHSSDLSPQPSALKPEQDLLERIESDLARGPT
jgi:glycosyltransferase involved in cell wall biosynthesis